MVLPKFEYLAPKTLDEACKLYAEQGADARVMAGATDLVPLMNAKVLTPKTVIDLKNIPGLEYLDYSEAEGLKIGALTKLRDIEKSAMVQEKYPAVAQAAKYVASTQVRAKGTMVGNICNASPSCDTGPILLALNARVTVVSQQGQREIPLSEFFVGVKKTALVPGEIVTGIIIPPMAADEHAAYIKHAVRKAMDLAIVGVAAWLKMDGARCVDARIVAGAVATTPVRLPEAEKLLIGQEVTDDVLVACSEAAKESVHPISDIRASDIYRKDMIRVFTKRAVKQALEG